MIFIKDNNVICQVSPGAQNKSFRDSIAGVRLALLHLNIITWPGTDLILTQLQLASTRKHKPQTLVYLFENLHKKNYFHQSGPFMVRPQR